MLNIIKMSGVVLILTIPKEANSPINENHQAEAQTADKKPNHLEKTLRDLLNQFEINDAHWSSVDKNRKWQVTCSLNAGPHCDELLAALTYHEYGYAPDSSLAVIPCLMTRGRENKSITRIPTEWAEPARTVRAKLTVGHVVENESQKAALKIDFLLKVLMSSIIAAVGLIENFTVFVVSSMLLSPLLGPVLAVTFGYQIPDRSLIRKGILSESVGLLTCVIVGIICGFFVGICGGKGGQLLTDEMISRSEPRALWVGVLIAIPSGGAVALAVMGDDTSSLAGVAISVSLMPPAVNAGLLWALSISQLLYYNPPTLTHKYIYDDTEPWRELALLGATSLCLTFVNIICIIGAALILLKIKEITPIVSGTKRKFWTEDLKIARDYNKKCQCSQADKIFLRAVSLLNINQESQGVAMKNVHWTWSPCTEVPRPTIRDIEAHYASTSKTEFDTIKENEI